MAVKFLKCCQQGALYTKDEIAGFDAETEDRLIKQEFAKAYEAPKDEASKGKGGAAAAQA
ncbi:MAG: hypothetical protein ACTMKV_13230 [Sphingomonas parapaucimobilis]